MSDETPPSAMVVVRWGDPVLDALDEPLRYHAVIADLPVAIANVICVELLDWQVRNGGFKQYFENSYGIGIDGAVKGFDMMGLPKCAAIARTARERFGAVFPEIRSQRIEEVNVQRLDFNALDDAYYALDMDAVYLALDAYATAAMAGHAH